MEVRDTSHRTNPPAARGRWRLIHVFKRSATLLQEYLLRMEICTNLNDYQWGSLKPSTPWTPCDRLSTGRTHWHACLPHRFFAIQGFSSKILIWRRLANVSFRTTAAATIDASCNGSSDLSKVLVHSSKVASVVGFVPYVPLRTTISPSTGIFPPQPSLTLSSRSFAAQGSTQTTTPPFSVRTPSQAHMAMPMNSIANVRGGGGRPSTLMLSMLLMLLLLSPQLATR
jgi:hypothetical protein